MWQNSRILLLDSFRCARNELSTAFLHHQAISERNIRREVQRYLLKSPKGTSYTRSTRQSLPSPRSWFRQRLSFLLEETKKSKNCVAAEEALKCALKRPDVLKFCDFTWVKNAFLSCRTLEEWENLKQALYSEQINVLSLSSSSCTSKAIQHPLLASLRELDALAAPSGSSSSSGALTGAPSSLLKRKAKGPSKESKKGSESQLSEECAVDRSPGVHRPHVRHSVHNVHHNGNASQGQHGAHGSVQLPSSLSLACSTFPRIPAMPSLQAPRGETAVLQSSPPPSFLRYFVQQGLVKNEVELIALVTAIRSRPQHLTFRINGCSSLGSAVKLLFKSTQDGGRMDGIRPLTWLPPSFGAFALECSSRIPYPQLLAHRRLLQHLTQDGLASYQSLSSMLAVFFLQPQPGEHILDACASPGSKTSLILDVIGSSEAALVKQRSSRDSFAGSGGYHSPLHKAEHEQKKKVGSTVEQGVVIANDVSFSRATLLQERFRQCNVALPFFGIVESNFEEWGKKRTKRGMHHFGGGMEGGQWFDKILVDAPCSGESRLGRENEEAKWRLWHPCRGLDFFPKQVALLRQAIQCARSNGRAHILYTTCTFNPLENECVVAAILREYAGMVRLIPLPQIEKDNDFPFFKRRRKREGEESEEEPPVVLSPALPYWYVPSRNGVLYATHQEAIRHHPHDVRHFPREAFAFADDDEENANKTGSKRSQYHEMKVPNIHSATHSSKLPSSPTSSLYASVRNSIHQHAKRLFPHRNDGAEGFFFALLEVHHRERGESSTLNWNSSVGEEGIKSNPFFFVQEGKRPPFMASFLPIKEEQEEDMWGDYRLLSLQHQSIQSGLLPFFFDALSVVRSPASLSNGLAITEAFQKMSSLFTARRWSALLHRDESGVVIAAQALLQRLPNAYSSGNGTNALGGEGGGSGVPECFSPVSSRVRHLGASVMTITSSSKNDFSRSSNLSLPSRPHDAAAPAAHLTDEGAHWVRHHVLASTDSPLSSPFFLELPFPMIEMLLSQQALSVVFAAPHHYSLDEAPAHEASFSGVPLNSLSGGGQDRADGAFFLSLPSSETADIDKHYPHLRTEDSLACRFKFSSLPQRLKWEALFECLTSVIASIPPGKTTGEVLGNTLKSQDTREGARNQSFSHEKRKQETVRGRWFNAVVGVAHPSIQIPSSDYCFSISDEHRGSRRPRRGAIRSATLLPEFADTVGDWVFPVQVRNTGEEVAVAGHCSTRPTMRKACDIQLLSSATMRHRCIALLGKVQRCLQDKLLGSTPLNHSSSKASHSPIQPSSPALYGVTGDSPYSSTA